MKEISLQLQGQFEKKTNKHTSISACKINTCTVYWWVFRGSFEIAFTSDAYPRCVWHLDSPQIKWSGLSDFILPEPLTNLEGDGTSPVTSWCFLKFLILYHWLYCSFCIGQPPQLAPLCCQSPIYPSKIISNFLSWFLIPVFLIP